MAHPRRSREEWREHVTAWKSSGQSGAAYARKHGLKESTLAWWRWELGREASEVSERPPLTLVPVTSPVTTPAAAEPKCSPIEVGLPDGLVVRVADHADPEQVARLVRALVAAC